MISKNEIDFAIIGSGICGMTFAKTIEEAGVKNWKIFESTEKGGGLAGSWKSPNGFIYDTGTHVIFFQTEEFYKTIMGLNLEVIPQSRIAKHSNKELSEKCLSELKACEDQQEKPLYANFYEKCLNEYGETINNVFMKPYNKKIWSVGIERLGTHWTRFIIPPVRMSDIKSKMENADAKENWGWNSQFIYPKYGGNGAIWEAFQKKLLPKEKVFNNYELVEVDVKNKTILFNNGESFKWKKLITTICILELFKKLKNFEEEKALKAALDKLEHTSIHLIGLGFKGKFPEKLAPLHWIYFPDMDIPFFRITFISNLSKYTVPEDCFNMIVEVNNTTMSDSKEIVIEKCLESLEKHFGIKKSDHIDTYYRFLYYAYPIPLINVPDVSKEIIEILKKYDIVTIGRFADWRYEESNQEPLYVKTTGFVKDYIKNFIKSIY